MLQEGTDFGPCLFFAIGFYRCTHNGRDVVQDGLDPSESANELGALVCC
jgi:hypothetical protein